MQKRGEGSQRKPSEPQPTPSPDQSFHEEQLSDIPSSSQPQKTQKHRKGRKLSNRFFDPGERQMTAQSKAEISNLKEERSQELVKRKRIQDTARLKLFKMGTSKRRSLDKEDASKHGRNLNARLISEEDDLDDGFNVVRDEGITHVEGDVEQVVIAAAEVVNLDDERARLEEAMRLQAEQEAKHTKLIHLDRLLAQRMQEEEEMTEANVDSNEELSKILLGENEPGEDFATRMTSGQLKKLSDEEIKAKYERLSDTSKKQKTTEVKEVPVTEETVKEPTAAKQEEIEQPIKNSGRHKSMARKRKLGQSTAKEDDENDLSALYQLVIDKYQDEIPKGFDLILWGDLTTMFHLNEEDDLWKSQEKWNIVSWKLHKSTGVHTLKTDTEMCDVPQCRMASRVLGNPSLGSNSNTSSNDQAAAIKEIHVVETLFRIVMETLDALGSICNSIQANRDNAYVIPCKVSHADDSINLNVDESTIPSDPIIQSVDINTKSASYAGAAGASAKDQQKLILTFVPWWLLQYLMMLTSLFLVKLSKRLVLALNTLYMATLFEREWRFRWLNTMPGTTG
ncbi:hypothetical protein Tco_0138634 [Tanacetum coccineum]